MTDPLVQDAADMIRRYGDERADPAAVVYTNAELVARRVLALRRAPARLEATHRGVTARVWIDDDGVLHLDLRDAAAGPPPVLPDPTETFRSG